MADPSGKTKKAAAKDKKGKKGAESKKKGDKGKAGGHAQMSVANHPTASAHVRRAKGWGACSVLASPRSCR